MEAPYNGGKIHIPPLRDLNEKTFMDKVNNGGLLLGDQSLGSRIIK